MANAFKTFSAQNIDTASTGETTLYTCPSSPTTETTIIGLNIANILAVSITVTVELHDGGISGTTNLRHIVKDAIVPVGSSLVAVGGDQKIVMNASDILRITASQASAADVTLSVLEIT